jgi:hypothetical protein
VGFDWNKKWHVGEAPVRDRRTWKDFVQAHPKETALAFLLAVALLVLAGVSW